jgi:hypothetical protein
VVGLLEMVGLFEMVGSFKVVGVAEEEVGFMAIVNPAGVVSKPETEGVLSRG